MHPLKNDLAIGALHVQPHRLLGPLHVAGQRVALGLVDAPAKIDSLSDLYADDGDLDGNSTLRSIISSLKNSMRSSLPDGYDLSDIGLSFTSSGTLEIDSDALEEALTNNPDILNICLTDDGGVFDAIQDLLEPYTESGGILSDMEDSAQDSLDRVTARQEAWDTKMENLYNLYLEDFTQMQITLAELESSLSILSS